MSPSPADEMRQLRDALPDDLSAPIDALIASLADDESVAGVAVGERAPSFALPDARGDRVALDDLLADGPVVVSFYRGAWCPFCSIELRGLQEILPEIRALGASLVAVSPQAPDDSLGLAEKEALEFAVCSDLDQEVARAFRLRFRLSPEVEALYRRWGLDLG
jgi:peroxiredoxin